MSLDLGIGDAIRRLWSIIVEAAAFFSEEVFKIIFAIEPLPTEDVWPFGRPVYFGTPTLESGFEGGLLAFFSAQAYDRVWVVEGGEITILALFLFAILYQFGGFIQMWDWKVQRQAPNRDIVVGLMLIIFWFPLYYGFVGAIHALVLTFPIDRAEIMFFLSTTLSTGVVVAWFTTIVIIVNAIGIFLIVVMMWFRIIIIPAALLFGPVAVAVGWAEIPKISEMALKSIKMSIGLALMPVPMYAIMGILSFGFSASDRSVYTQVAVGIIIFTIVVWLTVYTMWLTLTRSVRYVDTAGRSLGRIGSATGLYMSGDTQAAKKAAQYGPGSLYAREGFQNTSERMGNVKQQAGEQINDSARQAGKWSQKATDFAEDVVWGGNDGSR